MQQLRENFKAFYFLHFFIFKVAGERFDHSDILAIVHKAINTINQNNGYRNVLTCEDEGVNCYILDSGGFLVAGNVDDPDEWVNRSFHTQEMSFDFINISILICFFYWDRNR